MTTELVVQGVVPGKTQQAMEWGRKIVGYYKKASSPRLSLLRPTTGGIISEIVFIAEWSSMSEMEEEFRRREADSDWQAIMKQLGKADWVVGATRTMYEVAESNT